MKRRFGHGAMNQALESYVEALETYFGMPIESVCSEDLTQRVARGYTFGSAYDKVIGGGESGLDMNLPTESRWAIEAFHKKAEIADAKYLENPCYPIFREAFADGVLIELADLAVRNRSW